MRKSIGLIVLGAFILFSLFGEAIYLYTDYLWFREVGYAGVFTKTLWIKVLLGVVSGVLFFALFYVNIKLAARLRDGVVPLRSQNPEIPGPEELDPLIRRLLLPVALVLGFLAAPQAASHWQSVLLFFNGVPFGIQDPLMGEDVGFYIFRLPALEALYRWFLVALGLVLAATAFVYLLYGGVRYSEEGLSVERAAKVHLSVLLALLLVAQSGGYVLDAYKLLYSHSGVVFGAGYTDIHARLPALRVLAVLAVLAAALCLFQMRRPGLRTLVIGLGVLAAAHVIGMYAYPSFLQQFHVVPNELVAETPYIQRNIRSTRHAYGLDRVDAQEFPVNEALTVEDLQENDATVKNIRLWNYQPLLSTYAQLQQIRTYYEFVDVDNDRYEIDGTYRQVMLSARELSHEQLPSRIWINEHLVYTHGYGVVFSPVNQISKEGLPEFFVKDIPPVSNGFVHVTRPEIYFGEVDNDYVFVKTLAQELDYPAGDRNIYTTYQGEGGVPLRSFWRKLLYSARFATLRISLSNDITPESRILYYRKIQNRVQKLAPFLVFDEDPYLVVTPEGRLFWIIDGYTTSERYPYSEPTDGVGNYIRNSVKTVVDAYNGTVDFHVSDPDDPVVKAYAKGFPGLFKPLEAMPDALRSHVRYPQDLFKVQARMYATYHMQDPQVFYNKEDLLSIPIRTVDEQEREMEPYYTIMRLPGEAREEFVLLLPFTPNNRDNMRAWLAARSDGAHYGKLLALNFPKAKLIYGPKQVDARIDQDAYISQQLSLWGQRGSQVIRGSLLAIPIQDSLLYVQSLYLAAEQGSLPELKRVVAVFGNRIAMRENLEDALRDLFGEGVEGPAAAPAVQAVAAQEDGDAPEAQALEYYRRSMERLREGDWAGFGAALRQLERSLQAMQAP